MKIYKINIIVFKNKVFQYNINIMAQDKSEKELELIMSKLFDKDIESYITPKYSLMKDITSLDGVSFITAQLKKIPNFERRMNDLEFLLIAANYLENMKIRKKDKISKDKMLSMIFHNIFSIEPEGTEMQSIHESVKFLLDHNKIKKVKFLKKVWVCTKKALSCLSFL